MSISVVWVEKKKEEKNPDLSTHFFFRHVTVNTTFFFSLILRYNLIIGINVQRKMSIIIYTPPPPTPANEWNFYLKQTLFISKTYVCLMNRLSRISLFPNVYTFYISKWPLFRLFCMYWSLFCQDLLFLFLNFSAKNQVVQCAEYISIRSIQAEANPISLRSVLEKHHATRKELAIYFWHYLYIHLEIHMLWGGSL